MQAEKKATNDLPVLAFENQHGWAAWLAANHTTARGVWLKLAKNSAGTASVSYAEALDVALCYGWIDGQKQSYDETAWLQKFTPRSARSKWSKVNREKAEALLQSGRMQPAGLAAIQRARASGQWEAAYDPPSRAGVPADFQAALDANAEAKAFFATLDSRNRYAILHRLQTARKVETRMKRVAQFIVMLARHEKLYP